MSRAAFAIGVASLIFVALPGTTQASPVGPIPPSVTADFDNLTDVQWRRCWRDRWGRLHCRRCWRDSWGRVRCW